MPSARDVCDIIPVLLEIIPEDQIILRKEISDFNDSLWNQAPELRKTAHWGTLANILHNQIVEIDTPWKERVVKIFNNKK